MKFKVFCFICQYIRFYLSISNSVYSELVVRPSCWLNTVTSSSRLMLDSNLSVGSQVLRGGYNITQVRTIIKDKPHQDRYQLISSHKWLHCHILQSLLIHPGIKIIKLQSQRQKTTHSQDSHIVGVSRIFEPAERADVIPAIYRGGEGTAREWCSSCSSISL